MKTSKTLGIYSTIIRFEIKTIILHMLTSQPDVAETLKPYQSRF